jgi:hypothetical protein
MKEVFERHMSAIVARTLGGYRLSIPVRLARPGLALSVEIVTDRI